VPEAGPAGADQLELAWCWNEPKVWCRWGWSGTRPTLEHGAERLVLRQIKDQVSRADQELWDSSWGLGKHVDHSPNQESEAIRACSALGSLEKYSAGI
jgi:hypothetical protein